MLPYCLWGLARVEDTFGKKKPEGPTYTIFLSGIYVNDENAPISRTFPKPLCLSLKNSETPTKTLTHHPFSHTHTHAHSFSDSVLFLPKTMHRLTRRSVSAILRTGGGARYRNSAAPISCSVPIFDSVRSPSPLVMFKRRKQKCCFLGYV